MSLRTAVLNILIGTLTIGGTLTLVSWLIAKQAFAGVADPESAFGFTLEGLVMGTWQSGSLLGALISFFIVMGKAMKERPPQNEPKL